MKRVAMLLFPGLTQLDLTGPWEVFRRIPDVQLHLVWKTMDAVESDSGLSIVPTATFDSCPLCEVLFVPGGPGQVDWMNDEGVLAWMRRQGEQAEWITSVCTGSLLLAGAGLLQGYRAACHWMSRDQLARFGGEASKPADRAGWEPGDRRWGDGWHRYGAGVRRVAGRGGRGAPDRAAVGV